MNLCLRKGYFNRFARDCETYAPRCSAPLALLSGRAADRFAGDCVTYASRCFAPSALLGG